MARDYTKTIPYAAYGVIETYSPVNIDDVAKQLGIPDKSAQMAVWRLINAGIVGSTNPGQPMKRGSMFHVRTPYDHRKLVAADSAHREFTKQKKELIEKAVKDVDQPMQFTAANHQPSQPPLSGLQGAIAEPARTPLKPKDVGPLVFNNQYHLPSEISTMVAGWSVSYAKEVYAELKKIFN